MTTHDHATLALDRYVVVVGASRGIGRIIAGHLADEGVPLVLAARSVLELERAADELRNRAGADVHTVPTDVAEHDSVLALATYTAALGSVAGVVNCAAVLGPVGRIDEIDVAAWRSAVAVDLMGTASCCAAFAPVLAAGGGGSVVNFSGGGIGGPEPPERISAYAASKAGVVVLTEVLGRELAPLGVRVNVVAPGPVRTGFMADVLDGGPDVAGRELYERTLAQHETPEPTDALLDLVTYLLSPASTAVTGRFISAKWDSVDRVQAWAQSGTSPSHFTLRRIDGALYSEAEGQSR
jgi:NAD(P)-dependent dehydrogenase (short-subunit alcohol dehydrogenase family)